MSLIAQMERDRRKSDVANTSNDLPLFAAAEAIAASKKKRGTLILLLPAVLVPALLIAMPVWVSKQFSDSVAGDIAVAEVAIMNRNTATTASTATVSEASNQVSADSQQPATGRPNSSAVSWSSAALLQSNTAPAKQIIDADTRAPQRLANHVQATTSAPTSAPISAAAAKPAKERIEVAAKLQIDAKPAAKASARSVPKRVASTTRSAPKKPTVSHQRSTSKASVHDFKTIAPVSAARRDQLLQARAGELVANGSAPLAIDTLRLEISSSTEFPKSAALLASLYTQNHDYDSARHTLQRYLNAHPQNAALAIAQLRLQLSQGNFVEVLENLKALPAEIRDRSDVIEVQAVALHSLSEYSTASYHYRQLLNRDDTNARWWMGMAVALDAAAKHEQARNAYIKALEHRGLGATLGEYARQRLAAL